MTNPILPNFKFSNGALGVGPYREPQPETMSKFTLNQWDIDGVTVYVYSTGPIPEGDIENSKKFCREHVAKWSQ
jgi:hypothetical protein